MNKKLRAYQCSGLEPCEHAILVFAFTAIEAKKMSWGLLLHCDEYTDLKVKWLKNSPHVYEQKRFDYPHVVLNPEVCNSCGLWGLELDGGRCEGCGPCLGRENKELINAIIH